MTRSGHWNFSFFFFLSAFSLLVSFIQPTPLSERKATEGERERKRERDERETREEESFERKIDR